MSVARGVADLPRVQADTLICTTHRGYYEAGGRIILGNGGGVNRQESTISHREAKPKKIIFRRHYNAGE